MQHEFGRFTCCSQEAIASPLSTDHPFGRCIQLAARWTHSLAENEATPTVTDKMIADIFGAILKGAREGNPEAALIVLKVAEEQREAEDG